MSKSPRLCLNLWRLKWMLPPHVPGGLSNL